MHLGPTGCQNVRPTRSSISFTDNILRLALIFRVFLRSHRPHTYWNSPCSHQNPSKNIQNCCWPIKERLWHRRAEHPEHTYPLNSKFNPWDFLPFTSRGISGLSDSCPDSLLCALQINPQFLSPPQYQWPANQASGKKTQGFWSSTKISNLYQPQRFSSLKWWLCQ